MNNEKMNEVLKSLLGDNFEIIETTDNDLAVLNSGKVIFKGNEFDFGTFESRRTCNSGGILSYYRYCILNRMNIIPSSAFVFLLEVFCGNIIPEEKIKIQYNTWVKTK